MQAESCARELPDEGRGPEYEKQLYSALDRLEALTVVKSARIDTKYQMSCYRNTVVRCKSFVEGGPAAIGRPQQEKAGRPDGGPHISQCYRKADHKA